MTNDKSFLIVIVKIQIKYVIIYSQQRRFRIWQKL